MQAPIVWNWKVRNEAYDNSVIYKAKMKADHGKQILRKNFEPNQKVHLYDSHLYLHLGKLRSWWTGPFVVKQVFPNSAVEIKNSSDRRVFRVNGQWLKHYIDQVSQFEEITLVALVYQPWVVYFHYFVHYFHFFFFCVWFFVFFYFCVWCVFFQFVFYFCCILENHFR